MTRRHAARARARPAARHGFDARLDADILLIATDVAARGLDVAQLSHVFNCDLPSAPDACVHRIGRTGRAGREGTAITLMKPREHRHLRTIEAITRQKIEVCRLPTVADLRARRLELTRASLRERLLEGNPDDVRVVVESLAEEFDVVDIAAAAVTLAQTATERVNEEEIPEPMRAERPQGPRGAHRKGAAGRTESRRAAPGAGPGVRIFIGAGRQAGIRPADVVGAITGEAGIASRELGAIEIADRFSLVGGGAGDASGRDRLGAAPDEAAGTAGRRAAGQNVSSCSCTTGNLAGALIEADAAGRSRSVRCPSGSSTRRCPATPQPC